MNVKSKNGLIVLVVLGSLLGTTVLSIPANGAEPWTGNITINADGTASPSDAPVMCHKDTYTLKNDISGNIVILRSGITLNGAGYSVNGPGTGFGIWLNQMSGVTIKNCYVTGFAGGIRLDYSSDNIIKSCVLYGNVNAGIAIMSYCNENIVKNNEIYGNNFGIALSTYCSYNEVKDNYIHDNNDYAFRAYYGSNYNIIKNNMIINHGQMGIKLEYCGYNSVLDNTIDTTGPYATVYSYGIYMYYGIGNHLIKENSVSHAGYAGIVSRYSNENTIINNEVTLSFLGIGVWYCSGVDVISNEVLFCDRPGLNVEESNDILFEKNYVEGCRHGVFIDNDESNAGLYMLIDNVFLENEYGTYISNLVSGSLTFYHNDIIDNDVQLYSDTDVSGETWDNGHGEGNYWSDYEGEDTDNDGVGDTDLPHAGVDHYPLMEEYN